MLNYVLSFWAGIVSILSPCILPILPLLVGSGFNSKSYAILALPLGLAISFSAVGISLAYVGHFFGVSSSTLNLTSGVLLIIFGLFLCNSRLNKLWIIITSRLSGTLNQQANKVNGNGFLGQFIIGILLGAAWTPCIGPTLGAAITLASKGQNLLQVSLTMILFSIGVTLPVVLMSFLSRKTLFKYKLKLNSSSRYAKAIFGLLLILWGIMLIFNLDKSLSAWLIEILPSETLI